MAADLSTRPIKSVYYSDYHAREVVKVNRSLWANNAVTRSVDHMQLDHYGAVLCEVHDERDGVLHAVLKRSINEQQLTIVYQREVKEGM